MIEAYRRLANGLPERKASAAVAFARDARSLRAWAAALPMANFDAAAQQLLDGLQRLNRQPMTAAARIEALEVLAQPIADVTTSLERRILGASFPLPPNQAALADLSVQFQSELAIGYRTALVDLCAPSGAVGFMRSGRAAQAGARALQCGHALLIRCYQLYRTPPTGAWLNLHDLYRFLATVRLDQRAVDDAGGAVDARTAYVHALLFALANPYRYTQREQVEACAFLRVLAPLAELHASAGDDDVVVAADIDRGPGYLPEERQVGARDTLSLRLHRVEQYVDERLAQLPPGTQSATFRSQGGTALPVDVQLARRVLGYVRARGTRGLPRLGGGYALDSVIGLHDLHVLLAGGSDFETFLRETGSQTIHLAASSRGLRWRLGETASATRLRASVVDQSLGGYRLLWESNNGSDVPRLRVGDLVGLALPGVDETDEPLDWMVGVVRWMRVDDLGQADAGIELLARRASPVGVSALDAGDTQMPVRGLLLEPLDPAGQACSTLLTSTELDRAVREMEISRPGDVRGLPSGARSDRIGDVQLIEATGVYRHFGFAPLAAATAPNGA